MPSMATKDPNQKKPNRKGVSLHVRVKPAMLAAITAAAEEGHRKIVQEVVMALEAHLVKLGRWPPKDARTD